MDLRHLRRKSKAFQTHPTRRHSEGRAKQEEATKPTKPQAARRKSMAAAKSDPLSHPAPETAAIAAKTQAAATRMIAAASGKVSLLVALMFRVSRPAAVTASGDGHEHTVSTRVPTALEIVSPAQDGGPGSPLSRPQSHLRSFAVAVVVLAIVLATVSLLSLTFWTRKVERSVQVCRSQGCQVFADAFKRSMRRDVPPCVNFVEFACGGYASGSSAKNKSVREAAYEAFRNDLILPSHNESLVSYQSQNTLQKAWVFYKTCEDVVSAGADNAKTVLAMMKEAKLTWPARSARPDAVYSLLCLQGKLAWPSPLEYKIEDLGIGELHVTFSLSPDVGKYALERKRRLEKRAEHANFFKEPRCGLRPGQ
ncbi:hypothetical protein HPB50_009115 [Hyalomma asiaticum]|uniref:Uncharacterized protein n=1 Tax=Hyalomma asiaticum TaxID=266040 RepID=A0ACB7T0Y9_HYAAI|nr:hypothetical protein HPB50_009115 [Hyalomma asiaticum]